MRRRWKLLRDLRAGFMPGWMPTAASARREKQKRGRRRFLAWRALAPPTLVVLRECGGPSTPRPIDSITAVSGILGHPPQCAIAHKAGDDGRVCGAVIVHQTHLRDLAARSARG